MDRSIVDQHPRLPEMDADVQKKSAWGLDVDPSSRGFWLAVCLVISAVAGWLMFYFGILQ